METLLAKAEALESEGISTYIYTGSYSIPTATLMGKPIKDITLIKKVIGVGEVAIADSRSPYPDASLIKELAYEAMVGGMLGGKAGVMHIHVGDGKDGLGPLFKLLEETDFPIHMFVPTHLNRNRKLFGQALEYGKNGGNVDLTAGESSENGVTIPDAFTELLNSSVNIERITFSSDGNGSFPYSGDSKGNGVGKIRWLLDDVKKCINEKNIPFEQTIKAVTSNVAKILKLFPGKGTLQVGSFADILVLDASLNIRYLISGGTIMIEDGNVVKYGNYEKQ
jgi:beta-aspartyl-dipeptidase (metallo-type)